VLFVVIVAGCRPADRYKDLAPGGVTAVTPPPTEPAGVTPPPPVVPLEPVPAELGWRVPEKPPADVPIKFVVAGGKEWDQLPKFWNEPSAGQKDVLIKVPLGLDDPGGRAPAANPPTARRWALGKKLFFDPDWLSDRQRFSCADCHLPAHGFARNPQHGGTLDRLDTPVLINGVYAKHQFWDGRVGSLEEVVQRSLEDNRDPPVAPRDRHVWTGVVSRLQRHPSLGRDFKTVFGTDPTQDAVGKALATYLRTLFGGDSLHDRAVREAKAARGDTHPTKADYLKALGPLDEAALKELAGDKVSKEQASADLEAGERLFFGKAGCARCHGGSNFTDDDFHNVGVGVPSERPEPGRETGRFAALPLGLKDPRTIGAFKTPTLRSLPRSGPYFHDGSAETLDAAVRAHFEGPMNPFLDRELADTGDPGKRRASPVRSDAA
jgi:cytochrome c peroxidase